MSKSAIFFITTKVSKVINLRKVLDLRFLLTLALFNLVYGCSGYAFKKQTNPLEHYGIRSVSVPLFYNKSQLPRASAVFTSEFTEMLAQFKGLEVYSGENSKADAYLIGVIRSENEKNRTYKAEAVQLATVVASENIGKREDFLVPSSTRVRATLELYMVRNATLSQIEYLLQKTPEIFKYIEVVFLKRIPIDFAFQRQLLNGEAQSVNQTQSMGNYEQGIKDVAAGTAESFRTEMLLTF